MNSKPVATALLVVGLIALVVWWRWPATTTAKVPARQSQPQDSAPATVVADDSPPAEPVAAGPDPATRQAMLEALAQLQQQAQMDEDARVDRAVMNNLRQLMAGSEQMFTVYGVSSVASVEFVGSNSSQYVKDFNPAAGETYPAVIIQGQPIRASGVAGVRDLTVGP